MAGDASGKAIVSTLATGPAQRIGDAVLEVLGSIPHSRLSTHFDPRREADALVRAAAKRSALLAGGLALPPGPFGWLTVLPEMLAVWRLQAQLVADIAAVYGQDAQLGREQMVYCLFRHTAAQALRDIVARVGERLLVRELPARTLQRIARAIGITLSRRALGRGLSRWMPVAGAVGVGAYAWYDTRQVGATAIALFGAGDRPIIDHDQRVGGRSAHTVRAPIRAIDRE